MSRHRKVTQALEILKQLGMPKAQLNERSALSLLALLDLGPSKPWKNADAPLVGITPVMNFTRIHYK